MHSIKTRSRRFRKKNAINRKPPIKLVTFSVGNEQYAIAIHAVQRILQESIPTNLMEQGLALKEYDSQTLTLINLSRVLSHSDPCDYHYLIIGILKNGDRIGIPVSQMPSILDIPEEKITDIPDSYRQANLHPCLDKLLHTADGKIVFALNLEKLIAPE
ncbi:MAG: chemotaxis protein CheW [Chroococcales cyanobacterium]